MPVALLIDLFDTLIDDGGGAARDDVTRQLADLLGVDRDGLVDLFSRGWRARLNGSLGPLEPMIANFAAELGGAPTPAAVHAAAARRTELARGLLAGVSRSTIDALEGFRTNGFGLALVSNCTVEVAAAWPGSRLAPLFDAVAMSCALGVGKPDPGIYLAAAAALGAAPADCVYLGDGADRELPGAAALGIRAVRTVEHADSDPTWTGETVRNIAELADLIGRPG